MPSQTLTIHSSATGYVYTLACEDDEYTLTWLTADHCEVTLDLPVRNGLLLSCDLVAEDQGLITYAVELMHSGTVCIEAAADIRNLSYLVVEAEVTVFVPGFGLYCADVTLFANKGRPKIARQHPYDTCGTPDDVCFGAVLLRIRDAIGEVSESAAECEERPLVDWADVVQAIEHAVDEAAREQLAN